MAIHRLAPLSRALGLAFVTVVAAACGGDPTEPLTESTNALSPQTSTFPSTFARQWMTNMSNSVKFDVISPPVAARTYAYGAIAMYEAVVHGMPGYQSLAGQLNGLNALPQPDPNLEYDWPTVLAATMGEVALATYVFPERLFFEFITPSQASLASLALTQIGYRRAAGVPEPVIGNSVAFGQQLAGALIAWANSDGYAEARYQGFIPPTGEDKWVPTGFSDSAKVANPVEPHFGDLRPLALTSGAECDPGPPTPFSTDPSSDFYAEANAVYQTDINLTDEQITIARYWEDGAGATGTPSGHWLAITNQLIGGMSLADAVSAHVMVSIGYFDSFIGCWWTKFAYNLLRPTTYIRRYIASDWMTLLTTPQFPTYTSGHSTQSGASAVLLTHVFGSVPFTDNTKIRRGFGPRSFANFIEAAEEAAVSRLYGGIHFPMDNNLGLTQGYCIGNAVTSRVHLTP
jgi:hypothetical protein